jgi:SAM-dependent methyltransferase
LAKLQNLSPEDFAPLLAELGFEPSQFSVVDPAPPPPSEGKAPPPVPRTHLIFGQIGTGLDIARASELFRQRANASLPADAWALFFLKDARPDGELARWRNHLWPWLHVVAVHRIAAGSCERETLQGRTAVAGAFPKNGVMLAAQRREHVLSPAATVQKFDANSGGWNGEPGKPGYAHFRWMRKYVASFAQARGARRVLDFGCGAGWVGIEAARAAGGAQLCAFDPSPQMVRLAEDNARASGVKDFVGRTGFGEAPPFPAPGEERFDCVLSSGVVSFSPDRKRWFDGLVSTVAPGGVLVVGDLNPASKGMQRRRAARPLLPARELNGMLASEAAAELTARGFTLEASAGYQRSWPAPQLAHYSDTKLGGALSPLVLAWNRMAAGPTSKPQKFDSWVLRARAPR